MSISAQVRRNTFLPLCNLCRPAIKTDFNNNSIFHAVENEASRRVIEKLGFKYIKDVPYNCNGGMIHTTGRYYELHIK